MDPFLNIKHWPEFCSLFERREAFVCKGATWDEILVRVGKPDCPGIVRAFPSIDSRLWISWIENRYERLWRFSWWTRNYYGPIRHECKRFKQIMREAMPWG